MTEKANEFLSETFLLIEDSKDSDSYNSIEARLLESNPKCLLLPSVFVPPLPPGSRADGFQPVVVG